ncbi:response regulator [Neobacillus thermocopriae]|uniref:Response regulator transcription factor n=1 Tax=Neobacillus thermocopriae TaxID=1215031 RepID=A0A6B3TS93_9BACI|nr:response regulator transcription factor [Neobacillus thermocopriae]MED3622932.1 response regulator transcription factor [Neobacillus thermocopriae]MED3713206.1 response regulator transcription factor [Neobacillus thermocopriae]NEX79229.1 response regulator transcription factor [Neobacillus thermocopriae]
MQDEEKIRVMLVDDQTMIRQGFGYVIRIQSDMELISEASDGKEAIEKACIYQPDVILMDVQMPILSGIEATREIIKKSPHTKIVILTTFDDQEYIYQGIRAGAVGYLLKDAEVEDMLETIRAAYRGEAVFKTPSAANVLSRVANNSFVSNQQQEPLLLEPLTMREKEILQEMAYGLRNDMIAKKLNIAEGTVKSHVHRILQKFGCEDRTQVVVMAIRNGMVK